MHILSRLSLNRLTENGIEDKLHLEALRTLDQSILTHCEGQYLYLNFQERIDITVKQYMAMAEKKEGSFLSAALQLASLTATSTQHRLDLLETIGVQLGIAKQISSDLSFLSSAFDQDNSSVLISEIANKNKLLPVVYAIETGTLNQKRKLGSIYFKKFLEKDDMTEIQTVLSDTHAIEYSTKVRSDLLQQSLEELVKIEYNKDMARFPKKIISAQPLQDEPTFLDLARRRPPDLKIQRYPASEAMHSFAFQSQLNASRNAMLASQAASQRSQMGSLLCMYRKAY